MNILEINLLDHTRLCLVTLTIIGLDLFVITLDPPILTRGPLFQHITDSLSVMPGQSLQAGLNNNR